MKFQNLFEAKEKSIVFSFGRMSPPTTGHAKLVDAVHAIAKKEKADHLIVLSHTHDSKKNPLTGAQKLSFAKQFFPHTNLALATDKKPTFMHHLADLHKKGYTSVHMVVGADRVPDFTKLLNHYNGKFDKNGHGYKFNHISVSSAGARDPDAKGTEGMSGTKMRDFAKKNDFHSFLQGVPHHVGEKVAHNLFTTVRAGMHLKESVDDQDLFFGGVLFPLGSFVVEDYTGRIGKVVYRGPNYVNVDFDGYKSKSWIDELSVHNVKEESMADNNKKTLSAFRKEITEEEVVAADPAVVCTNHPNPNTTPAPKAVPLSQYTDILKRELDLDDDEDDEDDDEDGDFEPLAYGEFDYGSDDADRDMKYAYALDTTGGNDDEYESADPKGDSIEESGSLSHKLVTTIRKYNPLEKGVIINKALDKGVEGGLDLDIGDKKHMRLMGKHALKYFSLLDKKDKKDGAKAVKRPVGYSMAEEVEVIEAAANSWISTAAVQRHKELAAKHKSVAESEASKVNKDWEQYHEGMVRHYKSGGTLAIPKMPSDHDPLSESTIREARESGSREHQLKVSKKLAHDDKFKALMLSWARSPMVPRSTYDSYVKNEGQEFVDALFENIIMAYGHKDGSRAVMAHYRKQDNADRVLVSIRKPDGTTKGIKFVNRNVATAHLERHGYELEALHEVFDDGDVLEESINKGDIVIPNTGPHKNTPHRVIHVRKDGLYNITPILAPGAKIKYRLGAASASAGQIRKVTEDMTPDTKKQLTETFAAMLKEAMTPAGEFDQSTQASPLPVDMTPVPFDNPASEHDTNPGYVVDVQYIDGKMVKIVRMGTYLAPMKVVVDGVDWRNVETNDLQLFYGKEAAMNAYHAAMAGKSTANNQELDGPEADKYNAVK